MSGAAQSAGDLRTLVLRRAGAGKRVVLAAPDPALAAALQGAGCRVLADPGSLEEVTAFDAEVVVAFDGLLASEGGEQALEALLRAAPKASAVLSFGNAAAASTLLAALLGQPRPQGLAEGRVRAWLTKLGLRVTSRDVVVMPHAALPLAPDTEAALRQLLEQLNPDAGVDRLLLVARPDPLVAQPSDAPAWEDGLTTVLVLGDGDALALDGTLRALAAQTARPLELVCAVAADLPAAERACARAAERGEVRAEAFLVEGAAAPRLAQEALTRARGRYLALCRAGDVADKGHLALLRQALERGTQAFAAAKVAWRDTVPAADTALGRLAAGRAEVCGLLLDRSRLGTFPLVFADGVPAWEQLFFARLCALFAPAVLTGAPTVERTAAPQEPPLADGLAALGARPLRLLLDLQEVLALAAPRPEGPPADALARALGRTLEEKAPALYASLRKRAKDLLR